MKTSDAKNSELTCSLNCEAEYSKLMDEYNKLYAENNYLHSELKLKEQEMAWYRGFMAAVELIFRKQNP